MGFKKIFITIIIALVMISLINGGAFSSEKKFPSKPISVIIGFQPGDTDNILRPFVEKMPEYLGQPISFLYKPGAAGGIGANFVANARPDGYTLLGTSQSSVVVVPITQKDLGYNWESFAPISYVAEVTYVIAVRADARWKNIREFAEEAKRNPGKITYSSSGAFGLPHICGELFAKEAGIKLNYIPSQGSTPAVTAVLGGHVDAVSTPLTPVIGHIKAGTMRALASFTKERSQFIPEVPTFLEMGYPVNIKIIVGLLAPKGTPKEIVDIIDLSVKKVIQNHRTFLLERLEKIGQKLSYGGPAEYTALLKENYEIFSNLLKSLKK
jgi:tripartite-type tricarboxylate transporter receptor subunit TctC